MRTLIFDIETTGKDFESFDELTQKEITKSSLADDLSKEESEKLAEEAKSQLALSPTTGEVVSIGIYDAENEKGCVAYRNKNGKCEEMDDHEDCKFTCVATEKELLEWFWDICKSYDTFVTFNGRGFDVPFLLARCAVNLVKPTKNLMKFRYLSQQRSYMKGQVHIDLLDEFKYYGSVWKAGNLHMWCQAFGIESPKRADENGGEVERMFNNDEMDKVAKYNVRDIIATTELYRRWSEYMDMSL